MNEEEWNKVYTKVSGADLLRSIIGVHVPDNDAKFMAEQLAKPTPDSPVTDIPLNGVAVLKAALGCSNGSINGIRQQIGRQ